MKKIMLEVEVADNFNPENLDVAYVVQAPIGIRSLEFRIIKPAVQAQDEPVIRIKIVNKGKGDDITGWSNLGRLQPGVYELFTRPITDGSGRESEMIYQEWCKTLITALKKLSFAAQITGGTVGRDEHLVEAIAIAEQAMSLVACSQAIDAATPPQSDAQDLSCAN